VTPAFDGIFDSVLPDLDTLLISGPEGLSGIGPGVDIHLFTLHFYAGENEEDAEINLNILSKEGPTGYPMPNLDAPEPAVVTFGSSGEDQQAGDVDGNGVVNIIDALLIAQYYVGNDMSGSTFDPLFADVNTDGTITIVDALLVAQYYVNLIPALPVE
jgi:hypothetical protein